jgi:hypothetical protein
MSDALIAIIVGVPTYILVSGYYKTGHVNWWMFVVWLLVTGLAIGITYVPPKHLRKDKP